MVQIPIACTGAAAIPWSDLVPFQGSLKTLSDANYAKMKKEILELGFSEPISVWLGAGGEPFILNGHQRVTTIKKMVEKEGYSVESLPVSLVAAKSYGEAKRKVLALASTYGTMKESGLATFMVENEISLDEVKLSFDFPQLDFAEVEASIKALNSENAEKLEGATKSPTIRNFNIGYNIAFDSVEQQQDWFAFLKWLKVRYATPTTIGAKLCALCNDLRSQDPG